jgi:hypothetical protein
VRRVDAQTGVMSTVAGNGANNGFTSPVPDGTPALQGWLSYPMWVSFDRSGYLLISEGGSSSIQRVDAAGTLRLVTGNGSGSFTGDGVPAAGTAIGQASNVVSDPSGNLIFGDMNGRVRRIDASSGMIYTIAGDGQSTGGSGSCKSGSIGDGGPATMAILDGVTNVLLMSNGNLLLSDIVDCRVRLVGLPSPLPYTVTNVTASSTSINPGQSVTFTASVSPLNAAGTATGSVQFVDGTYNPTVLGTAAMNGGSATLTANSLSGGGHTVIAYYSGDAQFNNSTSPGVAVWVLTPTTVSLTSGLNPVPQGQPVTFAISIPQLPAQSYGSLGTVNLMDGATSIASALLFSNQVQLTVSFSTAGSHSLTAVYGGSGTYAASTSSALTETVQAASVTTLSASSTAVNFGQTMQLTATVGPGAPTGSVQFLDGTTPLGTVAVAAGTATLSISTLAAGSHTITAVYGGDAAYAASTSAAATVTVSKANTAAALTSSANPSTNGQSVVFNVTLTPAAASGSVQFLDGTAALGTVALTNGAASLSTSALSASSHSITVAYGGDSNCNAVTSAVLTQTVNKASTSTTLSTSTSAIVYGQTVDLTASVSPAAATGTVQFLDGATVLVTLAVTNGTAPTFTATNLGAGAHTLTAVYSGDSNYAGSTSAAATVTVSKASAIVALNSSTNPSLTGQAVLFTASVTPATATGNMQFLDGTTVIGTAALSGGSASFSSSSLAAGSHSITAAYAGDANCNSGNSAALAQTVNKTASTTSLSASAATIVYGQTVNLTASVLPAAATGTVQFLDGTTVVVTSPVTNGSVPAVTATNLVAGTHTFTAVYSGDAVYSGSTSAAATVTVSKASTTASLTASPNPSIAGQAVIFTAIVSPSSSTGSVQFLDGSTVIGTAALANGTASLTAALAVGTHSVTAVYSGDANYNGATSAAVVQTVNKAASTTAISAGSGTISFGQNVALTASVSPAIATGIVQFLDGASVIGAVALSGGSATLVVGNFAVGAHTISASYGGDSVTFASTSGAVSVTVVKAATTVGLTSSLNPSLQNQAVTFTAVVSAATATGTVKFEDGATVIGTVALTNGSASLTVSNLAAGSHSITAIYGGDSNYNGATSAALTQSVLIATRTTLNANKSTANVGQTVKFTANISPAGATGSVEFMDGTALLGTAPLSGSSAVLQVSNLTVGTHTVTATYTGAAKYASSTSSPVTVTVH